MDETGLIFDKPMDFAALLKSAQSAIAAAQQQQQRQQRSGGVTPQHSDPAGSPPFSATTSPTPNSNNNNDSMNALAKTLNNNNSNNDLSNAALLHQNQIISVLKQQSLVSPITQMALNSLSPFVPMQPVYAPSGYGRQILIYDSRSHPGRRREFAYKTRFTNQSGFTTVYYRCMACRALRHRLQRILPKNELPAVPCIAVKNDMLINDPDFPEASNHFCTPLTIEQSNERLKATFERGYKRARMKQVAEQDAGAASIKRPATTARTTSLTAAKHEINGGDASNCISAPFSFNPLLWTAAAAAKTSESAACGVDKNNDDNNEDKFGIRFIKEESINVDDACPSTAATYSSSSGVTTTTMAYSKNADETSHTGICRPVAKAANSGSPRRRLDQLLRIRQQQILQQQQQQQQLNQQSVKVERDKSTSPDENFNVTSFAQKLLDNSTNSSPPDFLSHFNNTFASANRSAKGASSLSGKSTPNANNVITAGFGNGGIEATTFGEISGTITSLMNNLTQLGQGGTATSLGQLGGVNDAASAEAAIFNNLQQAFASRLRNGSAELLKALNNNNSNNNNNFNNYFNTSGNNSPMQHATQSCFAAASLNPNFVLDFMTNNNNVLINNNNHGISNVYNSNNNNKSTAAAGAGAGAGAAAPPSPNEHLSDFLNKYIRTSWDLPENAGNSRSAAELTCTLILALARNVPQAVASMKEGKWTRKDYIGEEVHGKTLAIIGLGRIGQEVASRMQAFGMKTVGFDPLVSAEEAAKSKIKWMPLEEIWPIADYITVHVPLISQTRNLLCRDTFTKCKQGVRIINVARGGIVNEEDLYEALNNNEVGGAALDVFCEEPPTHRLLIDHPNVVSTPHLGASTLEAQQRVAIEIAENIASLNAGTGLNGALNGAALAAVLDASKAQYVRAVTQLSQVLAALEPTAKNVIVRYPTQAEGLNKALTAATTVGLLKAIGVAGLNLVNAEINAAKEGITVTMEPADSQSAEFMILDVQNGSSVAGYASPGGTMISAINGARVPFAVLAAGNLAIAKNPDEDLKSVTHNDEKFVSKLTVEFSLLGGGRLALFNDSLSRDEAQQLTEHYTLVQFEDDNNNTAADLNEAASA